MCACYFTDGPNIHFRSSNFTWKSFRSTHVHLSCHSYSCYEMMSSHVNSIISPFTHGNIYPHHLEYHHKSSLQTPPPSLFIAPRTLCTFCRGSCLNRLIRSLVLHDMFHSELSYILLGISDSNYEATINKIMLEFNFSG